MNRPRSAQNRSIPHRRGVTLVEMLVTVAILVIIMTVLVQVFQAATGAVSGAQAYQQIDDQLRRIDGMLRSDLEGVTARFTPPLDPALNLGYFEYIENEFADNQGEDSDDCLRFTTKAPEGRSFTGRMWNNALPLTAANTANPANPITVTSEYAEIIYFLRNGNLYRRVLLVAPQLQQYVAPANTSFTPTALNGLVVSWQGVNDLSARPAATGPDSNVSKYVTNNQALINQAITLNTLGDLTNRENRFAAPRFSNDYYNASTATFGSSDGFPDDTNSDNVPDYYPSLYYGLWDLEHNGSTASNANPLIFEPQPAIRANQATLSTMAFPYIFPGSYSVPQSLSSTAYGLIHTPSTVAVDPNESTTYTFDGATAGVPQASFYLNYLNHNPLDLGDNLPTPVSGTTGSYQTWWGFPSWRETLSPAWQDPTIQLNQGTSIGTQPFGLSPRAINVTINGANDTNLLPPMNATYRKTSQLFTDNAGASSPVVGTTALSKTNPQTPLDVWNAGWEDDLVLTGVRSFDVKAYDVALTNFADLGWGDDLRVSGRTSLNYLSGNWDDSTGSVTAPAYFKFPYVANGSYFNLLTQTFAHEGRVPPLINDNIFDAQFGAATYPLPAKNGYTGNIGDNDVNNIGTIRLRRVWDSWSTNYSRAPGTGIYAQAGNANNGFPWGPPFSPPIYPSYPAPYQAPLRGIQIQLRVVDPSNQRIKSLTIRQDFTDKL